MRVASRFKDGKGEKCPVCRDGFADFMDLGNGRLACYDCGAIFIRKVIRKAEYAGKKEQLARQETEVQEIKEVGSLRCPECGKVCGSKAGLGAHMRVHK